MGMIWRNLPIVLLSLLGLLTATEFYLWIRQSKPPLEDHPIIVISREMN